MSDRETKFEPWAPEIGSALTVDDAVYVIEQRQDPLNSMGTKLKVAVLHMITHATPTRVTVQRVVRGKDEQLTFSRNSGVEVSAKYEKRRLAASTEQNRKIAAALNRTYAASLDLAKKRRRVADAFTADKVKALDAAQLAQVLAVLDGWAASAVAA